MKKHLYVLAIFLFITISFLHKQTSFYSITYKPGGDTLEYKASAFVIQPNDNLGILLQRIPSVSINKSGVILAQGETVKNLLVDGEEYFTNAPSIGLQTLRADLVDKILFYHKITDQDAFTGIEDKVIRVKTINVILKKQK